jgi:hypothetical protein
MNIVVRLSLIAGLVIVLASGGRGQSLSTDWTVYLRRVGPLIIGMPINEVRRVLDEQTSFLVQALKQGRDLPREADSSPCAYLVTRKVPDEIGLMFQNGRLARVDVWKPGIRTAGGAQVGDPEARILQLYGGRIEVTQHHYPPPGAHYVIFTPVDVVDRAYQMLFETDGSKVTQFRIGTREAVEQVEGCA